MRCKLVVTEVDESYFPSSENETSIKVKMGAVWEGSVEAQQASENAVFGRWTPQAAFISIIKNPAFIGKFKLGDEYYVDFTKVDTPKNENSLGIDCYL